MIGLILVVLVGGYIIAETYKRYTTPQQKRKWENYVKTHHGEVGVIMTTAGIIIKSPSLIGSGIGLMLHDKNDVNKWFNQKRLQ